MNDPTQVQNSSRFFQENGFIIMKSFLSEPMLSVAYKYVMRKVAVDKVHTEGAHDANRPDGYGDVFMDTFLEMICGTIEQATNLRLFPTYSSYRVFNSGAVVAPHEDGPSCEISVDLTLGYESDVSWPIYFESDDGPVKLEMEPGDAIVYRGCDIKHWRERFYGTNHTQALMHYVDQDGPKATYKFDGRSMLGAPRTSRDPGIRAGSGLDQDRDAKPEGFDIDVTAIPQNRFVGMPSSAEGCFSVDECAAIVRLGEEQEGEIGTVSNPKGKKGAVVEGLRKSRVAWLVREPGTKWIFDRIDNIVNEVNKVYKFDLSGYNRIQLARYSEGNYYDWHLDIGEKLSSTRKLSITVQLSDPSDYEGGELELFSFVRENPSRNIGSVIVFPSFLTHRVAPVTRGVRWSLVAWVNGPPIR